MVHLQRWHGWCRMKQLPSRRVLCTPCTILGYVRNISVAYFDCCKDFFYFCHLLTSRLIQHLRLLFSFFFLFFFFFFSLAVFSSSLLPDPLPAQSDECQKANQTFIGAQSIKRSLFTQSSFWLGVVWCGELHFPLM